MNIQPINPFEDAGYWRAVREEQREDQRCSECGGFHDPGCGETACTCEVDSES